MMSDDTNLVSIIVPVYNTEKYIEECLKSIVNQTYINIEILCINDCSKDKSSNIADDYSERVDNRIITINKNKNEGLNMARSTGFDYSKGEYVYFLDSDDFLHPQAIGLHLKSITQTGSDMSIAPLFLTNNYIAEYDPITILNKNIVVKEKKYEIFKFLLLPEYDYIYPTTATSKLYRRNLIDDFDWAISNYRQYEDNFFSAQIYSRAKSISIMKDHPLYYYRCDDRDNVLSEVNKPNYFNGKKIGKVETFDELAKYRRKIIKKLKFNKIDEDELMGIVDELRLVEMHHRGSEAIMSGEFLVEDIKFLKDIWKYNNKIKDSEISRLNNNTHKALSDIKKLNNIIDEITSSKSYKLTKPLRIASFAIHHPVQFIKKIKHKTRIRTRLKNLLGRNVK